MPLDCCSSQSQWRGRSVTSRLVTPSFGRPGPRGCAGASRSNHFIERAAKIEVNLAPGLGLEHQDQARAVAVESVLEHGQHVAERTGRDPTRTRERGEGSFGIHAANCTRVKPSGNIIRVEISLGGASGAARDVAG